MEEFGRAFEELQKMQDQVIAETGRRLQAKMDKIIGNHVSDPVMLLLTKEQAVFLLDQLRPAIIARKETSLDVSEVENSVLPDIYKRMLVSVHGIIDHLIAATGWEIDE